MTDSQYSDAAAGQICTKPATTAQGALHRAAFFLSQTSSMFSVPRIVSDDFQSGTITMEYVPGLISLKDRLGQGLNTATLLSRVGYSLGLLHRHLELSSEFRIEAPQPWLGEPHEQVFVHGDFNMTNLCYDPLNERLIILDWETSPALPFICTRASRYLDIAQFVRSLLLQQRSLLIGGLTFTSRMGYFLAGYEQGAGMQVDAARLKKFVLAYNRMTSRKQWAAGKYLSWVQSRAGQSMMKIFLISSRR